MKMNITCCRYCDVRHSNCHSTCEEYKGQKAKIELLKEKAYKESQTQLATYTHERNISKMVKRGVYL